ncbi:MAG: lytic murein transglycosylase [Solirubrobacterales bacterium]|nr:lytic murein transglycosylase [Solirubrobacterales bacterium]
MNRRKLLIGLLSAGAFSAGFGAAVFPASAQLRTITVTLATGQQVTVQVDVPPGTPLDQIPIPGVSGPIVGISEGSPPPQETQPSGPVPQAPSVTVGPSEQPAPAPGSGGGNDGGSGGGGQQGGSTTQQPSGSADPENPGAGAKQGAQETTGKAVRESGDAAEKAKGKAKEKKDQVDEATDGSRIRRPDGIPTPANPTFAEALPGAAPIGVPNFFIEKFRIPPFLLPIYQAAGIEYGVRWEVLAAINEIETDYGRNLNVSSAGAVGWMQFMPATWKQYGTDANRDGRKDPYNPVDAIFAAARYLKAAEADKDIRRAIFAYNHADWYVDSVLMRARLIGGLPSDLVGSLTGLTQGHFPVHAKARYADDLSEREYRRKVAKGRNAAVPVEANSSRRGINIYAKAGSPVIATQDGRIVKIGQTKRLGRFIQLRDVYGNTYTYAHLKKVARAYPVPKERKVSKQEIRDELELPKKDPKPTSPATAGEQAKAEAKAKSVTKAAKAPAKDTATPVDGQDLTVEKERMFANPSRPASFSKGGEEQLLERDLQTGTTTFKSYFTEVYGLKSKDVEVKRLKVGSKVIAGTILGRIGKTQKSVAPHVLFEIRPAGRGAPRIDPKPILDGWKLLESTAIYRAAGKNPFFGPDAKQASIGQILLMSKEALQRRVLANPRVEIYDCGRQDVRAGNIDRRVLATIEFLAASGLKPTVTSMQCGHGFYTASGNVSEHSSGNAVDIAKVNGIPILGHQGAGSITDMTIRRLLTLQGTMKPHQIISLMTFDGADNTLSMPDHADHIHVGFAPLYGSNSKANRRLNSVLKPKQWMKLIDRLGEIENPTVPTKPSKYSIKVEKSDGKPSRASKAHVGE